MLLISTFELASNYLLRHHSETYDRVSQQYADAVSIRPAKSGEPAQILMIGNSLLLDGIDLKRLQDLTSTRMRVYPIFLEATAYYDWFYALQHLFRQGARPQVVVLGVDVSSFLANSVRQDYVPLMLFDWQDSLAVASDLKMDHTATSNLLLAHASVFWDTRSVIRTQILRHAVPHYRDFVLLLKPQPAIPQAAEFDAIANLRLERLRRLSEAYGAKLIVLVPPTPYSEDAVRRMTTASGKIGVETLVPIDPASLSVQYYQPDEIHLNAQGAALFTSALATFLPQRLDRSAMAPQIQ